MTSQNSSHLRRAFLILTGYQVVLLLIAGVINLVAFDVGFEAVSLPDREALMVLAVAGGLLLLNHGWLMTSTEFARARFGLHATPEEWTKSGKDPERASREGLDEVARRHHSHRNTTENAVYFAMLSVLLLWVSPPISVVVTWGLLFPLSRLGYTYGYLSARTGIRGLFMSLSLIALYGIATYLLFVLLIG